jgi:radical SAM-linked protein
MNKLRLKFSKTGPIKFVGHLDVMRYFQKAIRRAEIDIKYSEGFSPHQLLSFAQPLSVGVTSDGEYLDMVVNSYKDTADVMDRLNAVMNEGIKIIAVEELNEKSGNAMTLAYAARYIAKFRNSAKPDFDWMKAFENYLNSEKLPAMKKTKSGMKEIDMKHMIFDYRFLPENEAVDLILSMSSLETLKPALLFEGFFNSLNKEFSVSMLELHRVDIYKLAEEDSQKYIEPFITTDSSERIKING